MCSDIATAPASGGFPETIPAPARYLCIEQESTGTACDTGDRVERDRGNGTGSGQITRVYTEKVTLTLKGSEVTRDADNGCPAYPIVQGDGDEVLKLHSALRRQ